MMSAMCIAIGKAGIGKAIGMNVWKAIGSMSLTILTSCNLAFLSASVSNKNLILHPFLWVLACDGWNNTKIGHPSVGCPILVLSERLLGFGSGHSF